MVRSTTGTAFLQVIRCSSGVSIESGEGDIDFDCIFAGHQVGVGFGPIVPGWGYNIIIRNKD